MKLLKQDSKLLSTKFQQPVSATDRKKAMEGLGFLNIQDQVSKAQEGTSVVSRIHEEFRFLGIESV